MTREEAIEILRKNRPTSDPRPCGVELCDAVDMAISAFRQQEHFREATKKVEPLTLDVLREAAETGDPVWLVGLENGDRWVRIDGIDSLVVRFSMFGNSETWCFRTKSYGVRVWAYLQRPAEEDDHG